MSERRPSSRPVLVLVLIALCPALLLWSLQRTLSSGDPSNQEIGATFGPAADATQAIGGGRPLLSIRRSAAEISGRVNRSSLISGLGPVLSAMEPSSCFAVTVDGVSLDLGRDVSAIPASTVKVLVAAAAIEVLGPDYRFTTSVVGPDPAGGVIGGDIVLVGGGDPLLSGEWYPASGLERHPVTSLTSLDDLARELGAAGVVRVDGRVLGDGGRYDLEFYVPDWADGIAGIEAGPYSALMANDSRVQGDAYRWDDPIAAAAAEFALRLEGAGISSAGGGGRGVASSDWSILASIDSAPLVDVVAEMLATSDNNTAEMLVKEIDRATGGMGTRLGGLEAVRATLSTIGVDVADLALVDGSGLANTARARCETLVSALDRGGAAVVDGLAVAGVSGTLTEAFVGTPMEGRLSAKTGTLGNPPFDRDPPAVKALAGRFVTDGGERITFALVLNQYMINDQSNYRPIWDALATALASHPVGPGIGVLGP